MQQEKTVAPQNTTRDNAGVIALPPLIFGMALVLGLLVHFALPIQFLPQQPAIGVGALLVAVSIVIVVSAIRTLHRAKTTHDVRKPSTAIVSNGPFRFSRNPIYLSIRPYRTCI